MALANDFAATAFRDQRKTDFAGTVGNTRHWAEAITYTPYGGGARSIVCSVEVDTVEQHDHRGVFTVEHAFVHCLRDKTHADGGIDVPKLGDGMSRTAANDPEGGGRPWHFTGEIEAADPEEWIVIFERKSTVRTGGRHTREMTR